MRRLSLTDLYGSESEYRRAVAAREAERLEFTYPPRVQEALDFIERETAAYEERERQAACDHEDVFAITEATYASPRARVRICPSCERVEYLDGHPAS